ncbi:MAG: Antitoxin HigA-1 [Chlamydiales bacterium]|nr:Antitoxin HigA-1 [Chlamydiales bacterium]
MVPKKRQPTHPGKILLDHFLKPMGISQAQFVRHLGGSWTNAKLSEIIHGKRGVTVETALYFAQALGTSPQFWLNLQMNHDLWEALQYVEEVPLVQEAI